MAISRKISVKTALSAFVVLFLCQPAMAADLPKGIPAMVLTSPAFSANTIIPKKYSCQGQDINPPLAIGGIPAAARTLALIVDDPDAPMGTWAHWVVYNIAITSIIKENSVPGEEGNNSFNRKRYGGPCPPSGTHRYFFKIYALDGPLHLEQPANKRTLEQAMAGHLLAHAELVGLYRNE